MHRFIQHNAAELRRLYAASHAEFKARYDALAFPGGLEDGMRRLREGEPTAVEGALAFVEVRPYFNQSQYIATKLLRMLKQQSLSKYQSERLREVIAAITRRKLARQVDR